MYSIEMYGVPSCSKNSCTVTMFGWLSEPAMRDSRRKRSANAGSRRVERAELLERDVAVEIGLPSEVDDGHAAAAELLQDLVPTNRALYFQHSKDPLGHAKCSFESRAIG